MVKKSIFNHKLMQHIAFKVKKIIITVLVQKKKERETERRERAEEQKIEKWKDILKTSVPPGLCCAPPLQNAGLISRDA